MVRRRLHSERVSILLSFTQYLFPDSSKSKSPAICSPGRVLCGEGMVIWSASHTGVSLTIIGRKTSPPTNINTPTIALQLQRDAMAIHLQQPLACPVQDIWEDPEDLGRSSFLCSISIFPLVVGFRWFSLTGLEFFMKISADDNDNIYYRVGTSLFNLIINQFK